MSGSWGMAARMPCVIRTPLPLLLLLLLPLHHTTRTHVCTGCAGVLYSYQHVRLSCLLQPCAPPPTHTHTSTQGKLDTEDLLRRSGVNFTSIRPVYIYGPLNYNPVEEYFFHRIKAGRPIVVPGSGMQVGDCRSGYGGDGEGGIGSRCARQRRAGGVSVKCV